MLNNPVRKIPATETKSPILANMFDLIGAMGLSLFMINMAFMGNK